MPELNSSQQKKIAAQKAVEYVKDGMILGLGTRLHGRICSGVSCRKDPTRI